MLAIRIVPCLDVRDGRVVKGVRFQGLRDAGDPADLAGAYEEQGADELVVLDVSATPEGRGTQVDTVRRVRARLSIPLTVGGGVRTIDDAARLLDAGADKVSVNTAAVDDPSLIDRMAARFGSQCTILALDAAQRETPAAGLGLGQEREQGEAAGPPLSPSFRSGPVQAASLRREEPLLAGAPSIWEVVVLSGKKRTGLDAISWAREAASRGAGEILLTSWDRDGTRSGYDTMLIRAVAGAVNVPIIASGGAASPEHLADALRAGAGAVLAASIFHDGEYTVASLKQVLAAQGQRVRT